MLTLEMGGIGQPKQESWPIEAKCRNCLINKFYGSQEYEVSLNFDRFACVCSSGLGYMGVKQPNTAENRILDHFLKI